MRGGVRGREERVMWCTHRVTYTKKKRDWRE